MTRTVPRPRRTPRFELVPGFRRANESDKRDDPDDLDGLKKLDGLASVASMSVLVVASTDGSKWIAVISVLLTSLVVLGRYGLCS